MLPTRIFFGSKAAIQQEMDRYTSGITAIALDIKTTARMTDWSGVRLILTWFRHALTLQQWAVVATRHHAVLCDLHCIDPFEWPEADSEQVLCDPALSRHLSHTRAISDTYYQQVAELMLTLCRLRPLIILISDVTEIDSQSRETLLRFAHRTDECDAELIIGVPRVRGIKLGFNDLLRAESNHLAEWLQSLELAVGCQLVNVPDRFGNSDTPCSIKLQRCGIESGPPVDIKAVQRDLEVHYRRLRGNRRQCLLSMWYWFRCYGFDNLLHIASLFNQHELACLSESDQAAYHALVALTVYQQAIKENDFEVWIDLYRQHAEQALRLLTDGPVRCVLLLQLYQLSAIYRDDFASPESYLERGQQACSGLEQQHALYQQVWMVLIAARVQYQRNRNDLAPTDLSALLSTVSELQQQSLPVARYDSAAKYRDLMLTQSALRISHSVIAVYQNTGVKRHLQQQQPLFQPHSSCAHTLCYEAQYWIEHYEKSRDVVGALSWAAIFRKAGNQLYESRYASHATLKLAALYYQLGAVNAARCEFAQWRVRRDKWRRLFDNDKFAVNDMPWLTMALTEWRAGSLHMAHHLLEGQNSRRRRGDDPAYDAYRASFNGLLALEQGNSQRARRFFSRAIRHGNESFNYTTFARITQLIGQAYESVGLVREAIALYRNMVEKAIHLDRTRGSDLFPIIVRLMHLDDYNRDYVQYLFNHLYGALHHGENWWYIGELLELIRQRESLSNLALLNVNGVAELIWCAGQRVDCAGAIRRFSRSLPEQLRGQVMTLLQTRHERLMRDLPAVVDETDAVDIIHHHRYFLCACWGGGQYVLNRSGG